MSQWSQSLSQCQCQCVSKLSYMRSSSWINQMFEYDRLLLQVLMYRCTRIEYDSNPVSSRDLERAAEAENFGVRSLAAYLWPTAAAEQLVMELMGHKSTSIPQAVLRLCQGKILDLANKTAGSVNPFIALILGFPKPIHSNF